MSPDVSRRLGVILGLHWVSPEERSRIIGASLGADRWEEIPITIRQLLDDISRRGALKPSAPTRRQK